jgi:hypothetical protein
MESIERLHQHLIHAFGFVIILIIVDFCLPPFILDTAFRFRGHNFLKRVESPVIYKFKIVENKR